ncbi:MAG: serine hydrolase domain-containing protein [Haloferula sp.]
MKRREWFLLAGGGMLGGCVSPGGGGVRDWDGDLMNQADSIARASGGRAWAAWEGGRLRKSWRTHERGPALSITKSLACLACAKAAGEGWLRADERVADTIKEWAGAGAKGGITVRMLLQMTAGLKEGAGELYRRSIPDKGKVAIQLPLLDAPGTRFRYGPVCWEVLAELLHRKAVARGETLERFLHRAVMRPIRLNSPDWRSDNRGRFYLSTGTELTVTDLGRLGRTLGDLLSGRDAAGISAGAFQAMARPSRANPMFGGGVWRNRRGGREIEVEDELDPPKGPGFWRGACLSRQQPSGMVSLVGSSGQRVFIWPQEGRVIARLGYSRNWKDGALLRAV